MLRIIRHKLYGDGGQTPAPQRAVLNSRVAGGKPARLVRGQIMILTTLILSGTILAAVTIAGLLMLYQVRQAGNAMQSGRAVFVADAGLEYELYKFYTADCAYPAPEFEISPVTLYSTTTISGNDVVFISNSLAGKTTRGFSLRFIGLAPVEQCISSSSTTP